MVRRLAAGLDSLLFPYRVLTHPPDLAAEPQGTVFCMDSRVAADLPHLPGPTIVVLSGARLTDEAVAKLRGEQVRTLRLAEITPATLLRAVISATSRSDVDAVGRRLQHLGKLSRVQRAVISAFLEDPRNMTRLADLRRALAPLSREGAQKLVRASGFDRAEHLFTALRCAAWVLLRAQGLERKEVELYLGIGDRAAFRRACRRAGVPTLQRSLGPEGFEA
ncbi:MAG TPA: hypothetical protein VFX98_17525 [Longimicrobiaceae bacterium]|nr:hypothetical protein [Longimicrobiaceae bacterium]